MRRYNWAVRASWARTALFCLCAPACRAGLGFLLLFPSVSSGGLNLLENPSAESVFLSGWDIHASTPSDGWSVRNGGVDGCRRFITSYEWCIRSQELDLAARGYATAELDAAPAVDVAEWFGGNDPDPNDYAYLRVELRDAGHVAFATFDTGIFRTSAGWREISHQFTGYGPGLRYIYWEDGGRDTEDWGTQYGATLDAASCQVDLPLPGPRLELSSPVIDFGTRGTGDGPTAQQALVITNTGEAPLDFNVCLFGPFFADFIITSAPTVRRLEPGHSALISLIFDPTLDGDKIGILRVWCNDPDQPLVSLPLLGTAIYTPPTTFSYFELLDFATLWYSQDPIAYDLIPDARLDEKDLVEILKAWNN